MFNHNYESFRRNLSEVITDSLYWFVLDYRVTYFSCEFPVYLWFIFASITSSLTNLSGMQKWQPLSTQQRHGGSIVEVFRIVEEVCGVLVYCMMFS